MQAPIKINDFLYYIGVNDRESPLFERQWPLPNGVTYNSYLIADQKTALLECVHASKAKELVENLEKALNGRPLDYIVVHHMEPDHTGSLPLIRKLYPEARLVGNKKTFEFLENFYGYTAEDNVIVDNGDELDLGDHKLTFVKTPMVHWPESMISYEKTEGILFSQDIFGSFGTLTSSIFDDEIVDAELWAPEMVRYYVNIVGKYSAMAIRSLSQLDGLSIKLICPIHGPIWRSKPEKVLKLYDTLASQKVKEGVCIVYGSMYGNTRTMAEYIGQKLGENGVFDVKTFDVSKTHASYLQTELWKYRCIILGACAYNNDLFPPMKTLLSILEENKMANHSIGIFGNYSWSGGAVKVLKAFAEGQKYHLLEPVVEARSHPKEADFEALEKLAIEAAKDLKAHSEEDASTKFTF